MDPGNNRKLSSPKTSFSLIGRLDTNSAPALEAHAGTLYEQNITDITVDMSKCDFVSSAGLRVIVAMQKRAASNDGALKFVGVIPEVMEVFEMTGFDKILTIEPA